ncbi:MAG: DNA-3-methyladenine glycosylase I [Pseudomonadota bacterium]|nr:MAG: DNA-3-methyladenine glycosylase I [Pseudomonadota bacterium]
MNTSKAKQRCEWARTDPLYIAYHDKEWGVPVHNDRHLFEMLILEGAQAGLSWSTILKKRTRYCEVFDNFEPEIVAGYGKRKINALLKDPGIVRNRLKVESAVSNAQAYLEVQDEFGSFDRFIWQFVDHQPILNNWRTLKQVPVTTVQSDAMSKALKKRDFRFVGSTICYAFMQAVGMVNDHTTGCFRHPQLAKQRTARR